LFYTSHEEFLLLSILSPCIIFRSSSSLATLTPMLHCKPPFSPVTLHNIGFLCQAITLSSHNIHLSRGLFLRMGQASSGEYISMARVSASSFLPYYIFPILPLLLLGLRYPYLPARFHLYSPYISFRLSVGVLVVHRISRISCM